MNCAAGFTLSRYATVIDVIRLNWLPVKEKIQFNNAKLVHKPLYKEGFPDYLKLELITRIFRSNMETRITPSGHKNSFIYRGLQVNSISSIKLMLMCYKLLINFAFIFFPSNLSLSGFNQQIVYINFAWISCFCLRIITCDLLTCDLRQQRFSFSCFLFFALLFIRFNSIYF